ncbi:MAG: sigma-70 family RNA polymerase sigma factor [Thermacetogeniaceae bacterium]
MEWKRDEICALIREAQDGNSEARERLIDEHLPFVKRIVSGHVAGNEEVSSCEEYSIGLIALNEAIDSYKPGLRSFRSFAADVIRRRLIDYRRSQNRHREKVLYLADLQEPAAHDVSKEDVEGRPEIDSFLARLREHGIGLQDLISGTPKHHDTRVLCARIAMAVVEDAELRSHFQRYRSLPLRRLVERLGVSAKTVERHRKYIVALCLILMSDLEAMKCYIERLGKGGGEDA